MVKKLTLDFHDEAAFAAAYPKFVETVTITRVNRKLAYPMLKAMHAAGVEIPGVRTFYAHEQEAKGALAHVPNHIAQAAKDQARADLIAAE